MSTIDLVIKGGQLPDGRKADIAIAGDQIVEVSDSFAGQANRTIDAKVVCNGKYITSRRHRGRC